MKKADTLDLSVMDDPVCHVFSIRFKNRHLWTCYIILKVLRVKICISDMILIIDFAFILPFLSLFLIFFCRFIGIQPLRIVTSHMLHIQPSVVEVSRGRWQI